MCLPLWVSTSANYEATSGLADNSLQMRANYVCCVVLCSGSRDAFRRTDLSSEFTAGWRVALTHVAVTAYTHTYKTIDLKVLTHINRNTLSVTYLWTCYPIQKIVLYIVGQ